MVQETLSNTLLDTMIMMLLEAFTNDWLCYKIWR